MLVVLLENIKLKVNYIIWIYNYDYYYTYDYYYYYYYYYYYKAANHKPKKKPSAEYFRDDR